MAALVKSVKKMGFDSKVCNGPTTLKLSAKSTEPNQPKPCIIELGLGSNQIVDASAKIGFSMKF